MELERPIEKEKAKSNMNKYLNIAPNNDATKATKFKVEESPLYLS